MSTDSVCEADETSSALQIVQDENLAQKHNRYYTSSVLAKPLFLDGDINISENLKRPDSDGRNGVDKSITATQCQRDSFFASLVPSEAQLPDELVEAAKRLAKRLYHLDGFKSGDVSFELCKSTKFSDLVAEKYMDHFDFKDTVLHSALRTFLTRFTLPGSVTETDPLMYELALTNRELLIYMFCNRYVFCNPKIFDTCGVDACYVLVCSMMLLNTDLHGMMPHNQQHNRTLIATKNHHKKMSFKDFKRNLHSTDWGPAFDNDLLKNIYNSIKREPLTTLDPLSEGFDNAQNSCIASKVTYKDREGIANDRNRSTISCLSLRTNNNTCKKGYGEANAGTKPNHKEQLKNLLIDNSTGSDNQAFDVVVDQREAIKSKLSSEMNTNVSGSIACSGWLMRKCISEDGGKKTSRMKRGWTRLFSKLENLHMWFYRSENTSASAIPVECIQVHHSMAQVLGQHKRRLNVFTLRLATNCLTVNSRQKICICRLQGAEYIFQATDANDMNNWVLMINLAAALFSSPPFALPVGSESLSANASIANAAISRSACHVNENIHNGKENGLYPLGRVEEGVLLPSSSISSVGPVKQRQWYSKQVNELREKLAELKKFDPTHGSDGDNEAIKKPAVCDQRSTRDNFGQLIEREISRNLGYIECIDKFLTRTDSSVQNSSVDVKSIDTMVADVYHNQPSIIFSSNQNSTLCTLREDCNMSSISINSPYPCDGSARARLERCSGLNSSSLLEVDAKCPSPSAILKRDAVVVAGGSHDHDSSNNH